MKGQANLSRLVDNCQDVFNLVMELKGLKFEVLWTLKFDRNSIDIYINYIPLYDNQELREFFYGAVYPALPVVQVDSKLPPQAEILYKETSSIFRKILVDKKRQSRMNLSSNNSLVRNVTDTWGTLKPNTGIIKYGLELFLEGERFGKHISGELEIDKLTKSSKSAIKQIDAIAIEQSYRRHIDKLRTTTEVDVKDLPFPKKFKVFLSYRKPQINLARELHKFLTSYGNNAFFEVYLDEHNVKLGHLSRQILEEIESTDVFIPIVTKDYGKEKSISLKELLHALKLSEKGLEIAPIVFDKTNPQFIKRLEKYNYFRSEKKIAWSKFDSYVKTIISTLVNKP